MNRPHALRPFILAATLAAIGAPALAHDFGPDIAKYQQAAAGKRLDSKEAIEARLALVEVTDSPSIFFTGMAGSRLPIAVAHGEGRACFDTQGDAAQLRTAMRYVDGNGQPTERYPLNPNGSPAGLTAVTTPDGRFTALMPHPERVFRNAQLSWRGERALHGDSPWLQMFVNARRWCL